MNENPTVITTTEVPLNLLPRHRREQLGLRHVQIAEALHVTPLWEAGRRRMEFSKIPRIAETLQMDARQLCLKALAEFHRRFTPRYSVG